MPVAGGHRPTGLGVLIFIIKFRPQLDPLNLMVGNTRSPTSTGLDEKTECILL
jgi:hypothetical protein